MKTISEVKETFAIFQTFYHRDEMELVFSSFDEMKRTGRKGWRPYHKM